MSDGQASPERNTDEAAGEEEPQPTPSSSKDVSISDEPPKESSDSNKEKDSSKDDEGGVTTTKTTESDENSKYIKLRVVGSHDTNGINFRLKYSTALLKLKKSYSNHVGIPTSNLRFLFDGRRISDEDTPKQLSMNDDDQIEVYHEQTGGALW